MGDPGLALQLVRPLGNLESILIGLESHLEVYFFTAWRLFYVHFDELLADQLSHFAPLFLVIQNGSIVEGPLQQFYGIISLVLLVVAFPQP